MTRSWDSHVVLSPVQSRRTRVTRDSDRTEGEDFVLDFNLMSPLVCSGMAIRKKGTAVKPLRSFDPENEKETRRRIATAGVCESSSSEFRHET